MMLKILRYFYICISCEILSLLLKFMLNILIFRRNFVPLYTRNTIFLWLVTLGLLLHTDCMAQIKSVSSFNTISCYGQRRNVDVREVDTDDDFDDTMGDNDVAHPSVAETIAYTPTVALPLKNIHVNSPFGTRRDPMNKNRRMHNGLDLKARFEMVYSMLPGVVTAASYSTNGGYYVTINHGVCVCSYLHLSKVLVNKGQHIMAGQIIAVSGNTGKRTTGPHLHISCRWGDEKGKFFNPMLILGFISEQLLNKK